MSNIILASELTSCVPTIANLLTEERKGTILIIPTASHGEGWEPIYEKHFQPFEEMGFVPVEFDLEGKSPEEVSEKLDEAVAVYVCGGNTFFLLEHMIKSGFYDQIKDRISSGLVYIGSSAGIVVATPDIGYASTLDDPSKATLSDYKGLGLVDCALMPHMDHIDYGSMATASYNDLIERGVDCIPLNDNQVVHVKNGIIKIV